MCHSPIRAFFSYRDRSQKVSSEKTEEEDGHIKLDAPAESFAVVPGVPDVLVTYSQQSKEFCCYYLLSDGPASYAPDEVVLFAQVEAHLSDVSLSLISRDVIVHSCTCFGRLRLARNPAGPAGALSPVYTPAVCARRLYISSVALLPEFNARCFVLGLSDGSVDLVEPGTELSPLETRVGSDSSADPALLDALVPPQKIVFDPKKEDPLLVAEETCEKIRVYADAVLRDSNERAEAIASACAENKDAVLAIGERIRRLGESIDRSAQRIAGLVRRQSELEARYCDVPNQRVLEELYARLMRNKEEFTKRLEEYKRTKTASKHIMQDNN